MDVSNIYREGKCTVVGRNVVTTYSVFVNNENKDIVRKYKINNVFNRLHRRSNAPLNYMSRYIVFKLYTPNSY